MSDSLKTGTLAVGVTAVLLTAAFIFTTTRSTQTVTQPKQPMPTYSGFEAMDHITVGGVSTYYFSQSMTQGASTTCQWQTPGATSTVHIKARFGFASASAALIEFGKSPAINATTTLIGRYNLGAGVQATLVSTSSPSNSTGIDDVLVAAPSTWLAVKLGGGGTGSLPTGTCNFQAELLP